MTDETLYSLINLGVMPAWLLLALAPRWSGTAKIVHSGIYPIVYGVIYTAFLVKAVFLGESSESAGFSSLAGVMALFSHPNGVLTGWTHYLVFDLFVGAWIGRDALRRGSPYWLLLPSLFFCLMFGPIGLLIYLSGRAFTGKAGFLLDEND